MYKGRVGYWIAIISVVIVIQFCLNTLFPWVSDALHEDDITIYADTTQIDPTFFEVLGETTIGDFNFLVNNQHPDIYFADSSTETKREGYVKYSNYLYSPIVLYLRYSVYNNNSGFSRINPKSGSTSPLQIDLYDILEGIEQGKEWKDLGVDADVVKGPIVLTIPNSRSPYYNAVVDLFYMTLNNLKEPTEEEYANLTPRVQNILSKCEQIVDISEGFIAEYNDTSKNYKAFIGPEFLFIRGGDETGRSYDKQFNPIYFQNTIFIKMDMYVNENLQDESQKEIVYNAIEMMKNENSFYKKTGWRILDSYLDMSYVSYSLPNVVVGY